MSSLIPITSKRRRSTPVGWRSFSKSGFSNRARSFRRFLLLGALALGAAGCNAHRWAVKPNEREYLADRIMRFGADPQEDAADQHVLTNREGAMGGSGTAGGGCGCN